MITICGIAGLLLHPGDYNKIDVQAVAKDLLLEIESRGRDATGAAWYEEGTVTVQKDGLRAKDFVNYLNIPERTRNCILHTRAETQGSSINNNNNHPVITGGIVGVHNGGVWNDDTLFKSMKIEDRRIGEVDTEAIFAAIAYGTETNPDTNQPRLSEDLLGIFEEISGSAAIAWLEIGGDPGVMQLARISSSPLVWGRTSNGSFIFASTGDALTRVCKKNDVDLDKIEVASEGEYLRVQNGVVTDIRNFAPKRFSTGLHTSTYITKTSEPVVTRINPKEKDTEIATEFIPPKDGRTHPDTLRENILIALDEDDIPTSPADVYYEEYKEREEGIDTFTAEQNQLGDITPMGLAGKYHGFLRPGAWVYTDVGMHFRVKAQVWLLPQTFPNGAYVLRVLVPNRRYKSGYEAVIVERRSSEFEVIHKS